MILVLLEALVEVAPHLACFVPLEQRVQVLFPLLSQKEMVPVLPLPSPEELVLVLSVPSPEGLVLALVEERAAATP